MCILSHTWKMEDSWLLGNWGHQVLKQVPLFCSSLLVPCRWLWVWDELSVASPRILTEIQGTHTHFFSWTYMLELAVVSTLRHAGCEPGLSSLYGSWLCAGVIAMAFPTGTLKSLQVRIQDGYQELLIKRLETPWIGGLMLTDLVKSFTHSASRHIALKIPLTCVCLLLGILGWSWCLSQDGGGPVCFG